MSETDLKQRVREHWEREPCGSRYSDSREDRIQYFQELDRARYRLDYMLKDFSRFSDGLGKRVLEVGLGSGCDFLNWVREGADAYGRDLTEASVALVRERLDLEGLSANVGTGDAEALEFPDNYFDIYYSWGVLHHTPDTTKAFAEAYRVLKPGGILRVMLYHYRSVATLLVWTLYGPLRLRWKTARECFADNVESPGTKTYTIHEARELLGTHFDPEEIKIRTYLGAGDLLTQKLSERYPEMHWRIAQTIYPRWLIKMLGHRFGMVMTIEAKKRDEKCDG